MAIPTLIQAQSIIYRPKFLWDVEFITPPLPAPFNTGWFPAIGMTDELFNINSHSFETSLGSFAVPNTSNIGAKTFTVNFVDDIHDTILTWLQDWHDFIFPLAELDGYRYVRRLRQVVGSVRVHKLDLSRKAIYSKLMYIYPEGSITNTGEGDSAIDSLSQSFKVVGALPRK